MIVFKIIKAAVSLLLFFLNPMTWIHWSKSKERLHNEFYWIWLKYHCFVLHKLSYPKIIRRISEKRRRGETIHVGFLVSDTCKWNVDSIYREFNNLPGYDTTIFVFPDIQFLGSKDVSVRKIYSFFQSKGYNVRYGFDPDRLVYMSLSNWKGFDIVFFDSPWMQTGNMLQIECIGKYALTCYVPYGMFLCGHSQQTSYNMPYHSFAWKVFADLPWNKKHFAKYNAATGDSNVESLGYPKLDVYSQPLERPECIWKSGLNPEVRRVIWAPHWTVEGHNHIGQYSIFHLIYRQMLEYAEKRPEIDWLFKPHPLLMAKAVKAGIMTPSQIEEYYHKWSTLPNGQVCLDGSYWDFFKTSDCIITDSISFLIEYLPTTKPILRIDSGHVSFNDYTNKVISNYYIGKSFDEIVSFLETVVIPNNDYLREKRLAALKLFDNIGCSGTKIVNFIDETFQK